MNNEEFTKLLEELDNASKSTMSGRDANYTQGNDHLHNFKSGADIMGGTPAQACWGYMTKHLVALRDKVERNDFSDREDFLEKCQDTINYIRFLWCIGNDENKKLTSYGAEAERTELNKMADNEKPVCPYHDATNKNLCCVSEYAHTCIGYDRCTYYKAVIVKDEHTINKLRKNKKEM